MPFLFCRPAWWSLLFSSLCLGRISVLSSCNTRPLCPLPLTQDRLCLCCTYICVAGGHSKEVKKLLILGGYGVHITRDPVIGGALTPSACLRDFHSDSVIFYQNQMFQKIWDLSDKGKMEFSALIMHNYSINYNIIKCSAICIPKIIIMIFIIIFIIFF